jgi:uncharacterized membrane protein
MERLIVKYHLHPIVDHFTIALLSVGVLADGSGYALGRWSRGHGRIEGLGSRLRGAALVLLIPGAMSAIFSRLTGEPEAERIWDALSPAAQRLLYSNSGSAGLLSHAVLGTHLVYAFLVLAAWRLLLEFGQRLEWTRPAYIAIALVALIGLGYQGMTGGELVYDHGVGAIHSR